MGALRSSRSKFPRFYNVAQHPSRCSTAALAAVDAWLGVIMGGWPFAVRALFDHERDDSSRLNLRHLFSFGMRHLLWHRLREGQSYLRRESERLTYSWSAVKRDGISRRLWVGRPARLVQSRGLARKAAGAVPFLYGPSGGSVFKKCAIAAGQDAIVAVEGALAHRGEAFAPASMWCARC